ncbi:MAG: HAD-IIA family hydrolase [Bacteroidales bacterium]|jgi:HAD superfamily hydrolase (TIGR01450 family)|nr:HAD-IIA family hydrolase [Bacteroidales bacterium]
MIDIKQFQDVVVHYKTVFFDAFGVLKNHRGVIAGVEKTFEFLDAHGINYFILTNDASRSPEALAEVYQRYGIEHITADQIVSSGMLARDWLSMKVKDGTLAYLGTEQSAHYIQTAGLGTIPIKDVDLTRLEDIRGVVLLDDEGFSWTHDINKVINLLRKKNMPVILANTDVHYPVSKNDVAVAIGGIANLIEQVSGHHFIRFGKPDAQIFLFGYEKACQQKPVARNEILMVGDTLFTDIIGANKFGMDTVLVLSGNTLPEMAQIRIATTGIIPTYICENILI